jgi:hypothetical protein
LKKNILNDTLINNENITSKKASNINFIPYNKEWKDNVYKFNEKVKHLPSLNITAGKLIKEYMNSYNDLKENKISSINKNNKKSSKKVWISNLELKHTNDNINIYIYVYDRKSSFLNKKLANISKNIHVVKSSILFKKLSNTKIGRNWYIDKIKKVPTKLVKDHYIKIINKYVTLFKQKGLNIIGNTTIKKMFIHYMSKQFYLTKISKVLKKRLFVACLKQIIRLNTLKYKSTFITPLKSFIKRIYNKNINFNIINLKSYHLDSDILTQIISIKAKERKNKIAKILRRSLLKVNVPSINKITIQKKKNKVNKIQNLRVKEDLNIDTTLYSNFLPIDFIKIDLNILNNLKYKNISGIRLEASGRLTKRFTAQRSIFKLKYKGTLKNIDSSYRGLSSPLKRNHVRPNIQYSYVNSNNRIGAFGIKGWISSK